MAELSSPYCHHLLSPLSLDLGVENETPGFSVPALYPFPPWSPYLGQRARFLLTDSPLFRAPNWEKSPAFCSTLTTCSNWLQNTEVLVSRW